MKPKLLFSGALLCAAFSSVAARAQDSLPVERPLLAPVFTDNMVLQRDVADPVWGWAQPGEKVRVELGNERKKATADASGRWSVELRPFPAGGDFDLVVSARDTVHISHVVFGDVWICSGQSNMEFGVEQAATGAADIATADLPKIRLFTVHKSIANVPAELTWGSWAVCSPQSLRTQGTWGGFSAVGFYFGRALAADLNVPIGLVQTSWGGTVVQAWTSAEALRAKTPSYGTALDALHATVVSASPQAFDTWFAAADAGTAGKWQDPGLDTTAWDTIPVDGHYYQDAGIDSLKNFHGVVWFRKTFDVPVADVAQVAKLHLTAAEVGAIWINGVLVGQDFGPNELRDHVVPPGLLKPTGNVIAVRLLDRDSKGGIVGVPPVLRFGSTGHETVGVGGDWKYKLGASLPTTPAPPPNIYTNANAPSVLFNGMVNPLLPMRIKGAIWYQGESNAGEGLRYRDSLSTMITDWRTQFVQPEFPFLIVQLAGWGAGRPFAEIREAQWETAHSMPNTGIATAMDVGDEKDIHPKDKKDVGERLALVARRMVYGEKVEDSGPTYQSMITENNAIRIHFDHLGGGLVSKTGEALTGFELAGADGKYQPADAHLDGDTVVVTSAAVTAPVSVRYAWAGFPAASLYSVAGLPAYPFDSSIKP